MKLKNISKILQWMDEHSVVGAAMRNRRIFTDKIQPSVACIGAIEAIASTSEVRNSMLDCISKRQLLPGTPMLLAHSPTRSGKPVASCTVIPIQKKQLMLSHLHKIDSAQGIGIDLSLSDNPVEDYHFLNETLCNLDKTSHRPTAGMATLDWDHPNARQFITAKYRSNLDPHKNKFNISMWMNSSTIHNNMKCSKFSSLCEQMLHNGSPGILFRDRYEEGNPQPQQPYVSTPPCAEMAMSDDGDGCHFVAINLAAHLIQNENSWKLDTDALRHSSEVALRFADDAVDVSLSSAWTKGVYNKRRVSVNICGVADLLVKMNIPYDSHAALEVVEDAYAIVNIATKLESVKLASERGEFPSYHQSRFTDPNWALRQRTDRASLSSEWQEYSNCLTKYGIRNSSTTCSAPTGGVARFLLTSQSLEPRFNWLDPSNPLLLHPTLRDILRSSYVDHVQISKKIIREGGVLGNVGDISSEHKQLFPTVSELSIKSHILMVAAAQRHLDDAVSKTVNLAPGADKTDVEQVIMLAAEHGLKGITVFPNDWNANNF